MSRLLGLTGIIAAVSGIALGLETSRMPMIVAGGVVAVVLGFAPGLDRRIRTAGAVLLALMALYLRYTGHSATPYPAVDWIRPRGMDVWPGLLQASGMLLLLVASPAVLLGAGGRWLRTCACAGALLVIAYWFFPQHFVIDELGAAVEGRATMPVVEEGRIVSRSWGRAGVPGTPIAMLPQVLDNEARLAAIAHGMGHEAARLAGETAGGTLRATLWGAQRALTVVVLLAGVLSMAVAALVVLGLLWRRRMPRAARVGAQAVLVVALVGPPVANLSLRIAGLAGGLSEAQDAPLFSLMLSGGMLGCVLVAWAAGQVMIPQEGGEE